MKELKKILAVVDPTVVDQPAGRRAAWLAKNSNAELELLVCYYNEYLSGDRLFDSPSLENARAAVIENHERHLETPDEIEAMQRLLIERSERIDCRHVDGEVDPSHPGELGGQDDEIGR